MLFCFANRLFHCRPIACCAAWVLSVSLACSAVGADDPADQTPPAEGEKSIILDENGEPLEKFVPKEGGESANTGNAEATSYYMSGRLLQTRGDNAQALEAFRKAIGADPAALAAYQAAIPLLLNGQKTEEAKQLALKSAEHGPQGFDLIATMAAVLARQNNVAGSIDLLKSAAAIPTLEAGSESDLRLTRDLGLYQRLSEDFANAAANYEKVLKAVKSGQFDAEAVKRILRDPGATLDEFGDTFVKAGQPELALSAYEEADKYRESKPGLQSYNLALVFQQTGKPEQALEEIQKYLDAQLQVRGRAAYELLAKILKDLNKSEELIPRLEKLFEADARNDFLKFYLADVYMDADKLDEAEKLYKGMSDEVRDPRALVGLFGIERRRGDVEKLLNLLPTLFQTVPRPEDEAVLQQLAPDVQELGKRFETELTALKEDEGLFSELLDVVREQRQEDESKLDFFRVYVLGKLAIEAERSDDAVEFYRLAIAMRNDPPAQLFSEPALHLLEVKKYDTAVELLQEALSHPSDRLQQDRWRLLFFLSYAEEYRGQTEMALKAIQEARQLQPDMSRLAFQEAWVLDHAERWDEALAQYEKIIAEYPVEKDLINDCRFRVSNIWVERGDLEKGEQVLQEVLASDPENVQAHNDLGYLWADANKNLEQAREMIGKALKSEPENPAYLDSMGWVEFRLGNYEKAVEFLKQATGQKRGDDSTIYDHLGDALDKLGQKDEAKAAWEKALELEQKDTPADQELVDEIKGKLEAAK